MKQRGFVFVEFAVALPLILLLLYSLVSLTFLAAKVSREQVADYALETEAQEIIDRITRDARAAYSVNIKSSDTQNPAMENIFFLCDSVTNTTDRWKLPNSDAEYYKEVLDPRIYAVHSPKAADGNYYAHVYFKRQDDNYYTAPITGENSYGNTAVTQLNFSKDFLYDKILHVTFEMKSVATEQKVKFSTAVYMPSCTEIFYHGEKIL